MLVRDVMTSPPVSIGWKTPVRDIAKVLLDKGISAVPVTGDHGEILGMVSEGDLIRGAGEAFADVEGATTRRKDWWLALLAEGEPLARDFTDTLKGDTRCAQDVMSAPVVSVSPGTELGEVVRLLNDYRIKRVPVVEGTSLVGIVSRADLLRAFAHQNPAHPASRGLFDGLMARTVAPAVTSAETDEALTSARWIMARDFQTLMSDHEAQKAADRLAVQQQQAAQHRALVRKLIDTHLSDDGWQAMLHEAQAAAAEGEKEHLLLRFPHDVCTDGGRAIRNGEDDWPQTLSGEPAEIFLRWQKDLAPGGFHLKARSLDFPGGFPGDIGLFLSWAVA